MFVHDGDLPETMLNSDENVAESNSGESKPAESNPDSEPAGERCDGHIFGDLKDFVAASRLTGLAARRAEGDQPARAVAAVTALNAKGDAYTTRLVDIDPDGGDPLTLTRSKKGEAAVALGERGELYFSSQRPDEHSDNETDTALWMLPPRGEARVILRRPGGVDSVIAAGGQLFITASTLRNAADEDANRETHKARKEAGVTAILHEDFPVRFWDHDLGPAYPRLYRADAPAFDGTDTIELTEIPLPEGKLADVQAAPDGSFLLVTMRRWEDGVNDRTSVYHLTPDGDARCLIDAQADADPLASYGAGPINPAGTHAFIYAHTGNRQGHPLHCWGETIEIASGERKRLDFDDWPHEVTWLDDDRYLLTADRRGRGGVYLVENQQPTLLLEDDYMYTNVAALDEQRIVALRNAIDQPASAVVVTTAGAVTELAPLTPPAHIGGTLTEIEATAKDGTTVRAWLCLPADAPAEGAPLLTFAHGGPWGSWNAWTWRWNPWPFVERGYAVLLPDPAISTGYGQAMIDRGNDAIGDAPYTDILALIDAAIAREDIDADRTALLGGSYGGYMANWMAGHTGTRFRCIVTHASLWNIDIMGRTTDNATWFEWMSTSQAQDYSPHHFASDIQVPMLVIHGDRDYRVPISQGHALWHALLRDSAATGHKFLYYPDENHWILKPQNSRIWYETVLAFVDEHVLGKDFARPELLG